MSIVTAFAGLMPMIASVMVSDSIWPDVSRAVTGRTAKLASAPPHALLKPVVLDSARMVAACRPPVSRSTVVVLRAEVRTAPPIGNPSPAPGPTATASAAIARSRGGERALDEHVGTLDPGVVRAAVRRVPLRVALDFGEVLVVPVGVRKRRVAGLEDLRSAEDPPGNRLDEERPAALAEEEDILRFERAVLVGGDELEVARCGVERRDRPLGAEQRLLVGQGQLVACHRPAGVDRPALDESLEARERVGRGRLGGGQGLARQGDRAVRA